MKKWLRKLFSNDAEIKSRDLWILRTSLKLGLSMVTITTDNREALVEGLLKTSKSFHPNLTDEEILKIIHEQI